MNEIAEPRIPPRVRCEGPGGQILLIGDGPIRPTTALRLARDLIAAYELATRPAPAPLPVSHERP